MVQAPLQSSPSKVKAFLNLGSASQRKVGVPALQALEPTNFNPCVGVDFALPYLQCKCMHARSNSSGIQ